MLNRYYSIRVPAAFYLIFSLAVFKAAAIQETPKDYLPVPENARPMNSLLPGRGIDSEKKGLLKINSKYLKTKHRINFDTREVEIVQYVKIGVKQDSLAVSEAYYRELGSYSQDLTRLAMYRFWLNQLIGKGEGEDADGADSYLAWELPVKVPDWLKRWGADKPRLQINGSYQVIVEGETIRRPGQQRQNWFPSFNMDNKPSFSVVGSIGRLIHIEINNEEGFGTNVRDQFKITYRGEGDELEDNIIQEIEGGNTSLSLTGTSLTGYTETHKVFGLKTRLKFGNLNVTTIISPQEGGSQEKQTLRAGEEETEFTIQANDISLFKHFFLELKDRREYADPAKGKGVGTSDYITGKINIAPDVWVQTLRRQKDKDNIKEHEAYAYAINSDGAINTEVLERGWWERLEAGTDFYYDKQLRMLTLYAGRANLAVAARWQGDPLERNYRKPLSKIDTLILLKNSSTNQPPVLDSLMWRHVYNIGKVEEEDRDNFRLRVVDDQGKEIVEGRRFTQILGLTKSAEEDKMDYDGEFFDFEHGFLILPCRTFEAEDDGNCLTPLKRINPDIDIYKKNADEIRDGSSRHKFLVFGKQRQSTFYVEKTSHSVSGSGCLDITPGTEKLVLNGSTELKKDLDYEVLYEVGQITLLSLRARAPNNKLDISYECTPFFPTLNNFMLGTRLEYNLKGISEESILGATFLYKSQSTTSERPQLGREPVRQLLWGFNARLAGRPDWMTDLVNFMPFIQTEAQSLLKLEFEMAQSYFNPNTMQTALLDDFESSKQELSFPLKIYSWFQASPPGGSDESSLEYREALNYQHMGEFIWHSNLTEQFSRIYGSTQNSRTDTREHQILKFIFRPNDNLRGRSWGGVMMGLSSGLRNQSRKRLLEVVVRGREGVFSVDLGKISEDISIAGYKPNATLDAEVLPGEFINKKDFGLDGLEDGEGETGQRWECKPTCFAIPISPETTKDPAQDGWKLPEDGESDPPRSVNGTEGNNQGTGGYTYDTEDLNRNGVLDMHNRFARYAIDLGEACEAHNHCENLDNGWRKYQIPLYEEAEFEVVGMEKSKIHEILSNVEIARIWIGKLPNGVSQNEVMLARLGIIGNSWEEAPRNRDFEVASGYFITPDMFIEQPPLVSDSNYLRVSVISNREEDGYIPSPNTKIERDKETDEKLPEQSLVLSYQNLHPGEKVYATRLFTGDPKDLTLYSRMQMEVHPVINPLNQNNVSLALQLGREKGDEDSRDYYEIRMPVDKSLINADDHQTIWLRHAFDIKTEMLSELKNSDGWQDSGKASKTLFNPAREDSSLFISVVGDPSLSYINWMRLLIEVDSNVTGLQQGEIWVNDLRLDGVHDDVGTAIRTSMQADFSDFLNLSGNLNTTNGDFTTLTESDKKKTPASSATMVDFNSNIGVFFNKFFPSPWAVSLPLNLRYSGSISRPYTKPYSDIKLEETGIMDFLNRGLVTKNEESDRKNRLARLYQTRNFTQNFNTSYKKERRSDNFLVQALAERPEIHYSYIRNLNSSPSREDTSRTYSSRLLYDMSPFNPLSLKPFSFAEDWKKAPDFIKNFTISPLPERLNFTLSDFSFSNDRERQKDPKGIQPEVYKNNYEVELSHALDLSWRPFKFFNFTYRINVDRDFDDEFKSFRRNTFFSEDEGHGFFARDIVFGMDNSAGKGGNNYGILFNERNRNQNFQMDFNPNLIDWLPSSARFNSTYKHTRADEGVIRGSDGEIIPEHFNANSDHDIRFNSGLRLNTLVNGLDKTTKKVKWLNTAITKFKKGMDKLALRSVDASYSINHRYNNEEFTLTGLESGGIDAYEFLRYQMGFVYDLDLFYDYNSFRRQIILGKSNPQFMDYLDKPKFDRAANNMNHNVNRTADLRSGLTVPFVDLNLNGSLKWSKSYAFNRDYTLAKSNDTSIVWPEYSLNGRFTSLMKQLPFLKKWFNSFNANSTFIYKKDTKFNALNQGYNTENVSLNFNPLLKLSATSKGNIRYENNLKHNRSRSKNIGKETHKDADSIKVKSYRNLRPFNDQETYLPYYQESDASSATNSFDISDVFIMSYDLQTKKGIQFWRWYIKLENNLRLKTTVDGGWRKDVKISTEKVEDKTQTDETVEKNIFHFKIRPEVAYNFTRKIDALVYAQYFREQEFHTEDEDVTHGIEIHGEFTMRF